LFSGAGGLSEGFIQAGFFVTLAIEKNYWAVETYRYNHCRNKKKYKTEVLEADITDDIDFAEIKGRIKDKFGKLIDVVIGGPPCQGFSRANMRTRNSLNPMNNLVLHFVRAVRELGPSVAVMENVADLERFDNCNFVDKINSEFTKFGYHIDYKVLTATDYGVPQYRRRFFLIARKEKQKIIWPKPRFSSNTFINVWDAISDLPKLKTGDRIDELPYRINKNLSAYQLMMRKHTNGRVQNNYVSENNDLVIRRYAHIPQGGNWKDIPNYLMLNYKDKNRCHNHIYRRLKQDEPSVVITHYRKSMLIHPMQDRGLSVREAARIQSFPDHFVFKGPLIYQQQQVANAVPPLLAKAVAHSVKRMLKI